jgi:putative transposase
LERIRTIHDRSRGTYGAPRIHAELAAEGVHIGRKRVARLMQAAGVVGISRRAFVTTTRRDRAARPAPDLVQRQFTADRPDQLWVADITYIATWAGFLFLAVVLDAWSRRIVGWAMAAHLRTELVLDALNMAIAQRRPTAVIHHSDQGCQYTSLAFGLRCRAAGIRPSMGSVGDAYDCDDPGCGSSASDTAYDWPRALALICRPGEPRDTRSGRAGRDLMGA